MGKDKKMILAAKKTILAIDTSCDDTSVAVLEGNRVLANVVASQTAIHQQYGGVFPTLAKQAHQENIEACVQLALQRAGLSNKLKIRDHIDAVAVTVGPGLAPALEVGIKHAKKLAKQWQLPIIAINHIEAHALSPLLSPKTKRQNREIDFPVLALVISGGHSEFILIKQIGNYQRLGWTVDDSAGECLDKVGRMLDLGYPAGAILEKLAKKGNPNLWSLPLAMTSVDNFNLSFSGLKTASSQLINQVKKQKQLDGQTVCDLAATVQQQVFSQIIYKLERILFSPDLSKKVYPKAQLIKKIKQQKTKAAVTDINEIWLGGGVAANITLRTSIRQTLKTYQKLSGKKIKLHLPYHKKFCADNAAMIALTAQFSSEQSKNTNAQLIDRQANLKIGTFCQAC
ncbi:MAG: tRNA (adenosine(37)-N6)-threonylcarbamoyltransferase complex transferase subunit TsaD [Candidatus Pacebacteria bacterium]|jgi:N6-L-threonylcarbamoyladenine synthase|nr:tRNA (adenosine(37)-N6)-threonylcarbamoyltransferase complex transferase subunit TsaD [Candidatus Paceibacterota bacterium]